MKAELFTGRLVKLDDNEATLTRLDYIAGAWVAAPEEATFGVKWESFDELPEEWAEEWIGERVELSIVDGRIINVTLIPRNT